MIILDTDHCTRIRSAFGTNNKKHFKGIKDLKIGFKGLIDEIIMAIAKFLCFEKACCKGFQIL